MRVDVRRRLSRLCFGAIGLGAAVLVVPARAEDGFHPLDSALKFMNLKTDAGPMPDFVEQTRPAKDTSDYLSVGAKPPDRALKIKTPAEVKAMTADLDAARAAQQAGKRPKPPASMAPAKPPTAGPSAVGTSPRKAARDRTARDH